MSDSKRDLKASPLKDAQETVEAIHRGDIDAVVVMRALEGPQVVLLHGAEEPYRVLVEQMSDGALTAGPDGVILYVNDRLCELTGLPSGDLVGRDFLSLFEGEAPKLLPEVTAKASLFCNGVDAMPVAVWSRPISIGETEATLIRLVDLSIHRRAEQIAAAERFARSVLEQATEAVVVLSPDGHITHASWRAEQLAERPPVGCTFSEAFPLVAQNSEGAGMLARVSADILDTMLATRPFHGVEVKLRGERHAQTAYYLLNAGPLIDDNMTNVGSIVTLTDMTERKRVEERQTMMVAELNHRVKNILAIVQAVATQTMRSSRSLEDFTEAFTGRLKALAVAHDILTKTRWIGVGLSELLAAVLAPYRSGDEARLTILGPPLLLPAPAVMPLSMALHEMTTNALKYGALSNRRGAINVTWRVSDGANPMVELVWQESGGPKVKAKTVEGFGAKLIAQVIGHDLGGKTAIDFAAAGARVTLTFPVEARAGGHAARPGALSA
ncbi:MAG: HWE histidine kinase domain-containing protein [Methylocystis sp.]